jgi:hypothetical protein
MGGIYTPPGRIKGTVLEIAGQLDVPPWPFTVEAVTVLPGSAHGRRK